MEENIILCSVTEGEENCVIAELAILNDAGLKVLNIYAKIDLIKKECNFYSGDPTKYLPLYKEFTTLALSNKIRERIMALILASEYQKS